MSYFLEVVPAFGRDYKSAKAVKADWDAEKDFIIVSMDNPYHGKPVNKQQVGAGELVLSRFSNLRKTVALKGGKTVA